MKTKILLITIALFGCSVAGWSQTVTADDGAPTDAKDLTNYALATAAKITVAGEWTNAQMLSLKNAIRPQYGSNTALKEFDMGSATFVTTEDITEANSLFKNFTALVTVTFPTVQSNNKFNLASTFYSCSSLKTINNLDKIGTTTSLEYAFYSTGLEAVTLPAAENTNADVSLNYAFNYSKQLKSITNLDKIKKVKTFSNAFNNCVALSSVKLPEGSGSAGVDFSYAFGNCNLLTSIENLNKFTNITNLQQTFQNCSVITSILLPVNGTASSFARTFNGCAKLNSLVNFDKWTPKDMSNAFDGCSELTNIEFSSIPNTNSVMFGSAFNNCKKLVSVTNLDKFNSISNISSMFANCEKMTSVIFSPNISNTVQAGSAFSGCVELTRIENLGKFKISGAADMFKLCKKLTFAEVSWTGTYALSGAATAFTKINPNCLIFVDGQNKSYLPTKNVIDAATKTAYTDISLTDATIIDEVYSPCPFYCPNEFSLGAKKISYTRTFKFANGKNGWNSLCLPFDAELNTATVALPYFTSGTDTQGKYWAKSYTGNPSASTVAFNYLTGAESKVIPANTPCIIALPGDDLGAASLTDETLTFTATGIMIGATPEIVGTTQGSYILKGNYSILEKQPMYLLTSASDDNSGDFFYLYDEGNLLPFRAYFTAKNPSSSPVRTLGIEGGDGTTGFVIPTTEAKQNYSIKGGSGFIEITTPESLDLNIFSIDGRTIERIRANEGTMCIDMAPGIYVVKNNKVIVK